ncbi:two-component system, NarL family, sensor histidine kinase DesK [Streptomyces sp. AmelKG-E11A]|nr:two-component system, NarL family, sensor histidine kinase DesK [Streptomyces sp. AmelKG-E11A]
MSDVRDSPPWAAARRLGPRARDVSPRAPLVSRLTLVALAAVTGIMFLHMWTGLDGLDLDHRTTAVSVLIAVLLLITLLGQYARRHPHWRRMLLLVAQAALTYLPVLLFQEIWLSVLGLLLGASLASLPRPAGLIAAAMVTVSGPVVIFLLPVDNRTAVGVAARTLVVGLVVYGIVRLASVAVQAHAARTQTARAAVQRERARMAQDLHDLLGAALSAIAVRGEAAARTTDDPAAARREFVAIAELARQAHHDVRGVARDRVSLSLGRELASARAALEAAEVRVRVTQDGPRVPAAVGTCFGAVLRECLSNVLRHSQARVCSITLRHGDGTAELTVENDGVPVRPAPGAHDGTGLTSLAVRVTALGGSLTVSGPRAGGLFRVVARVPVPPEPEPRPAMNGTRTG